MHKNIVSKSIYTPQSNQCLPPRLVTALTVGTLCSMMALTSGCVVTPAPVVATRPVAVAPVAVAPVVTPVAVAPVVGVRGTARRTSRRTSRRVSRRY